jgi:hypothetical protein
VAVLGRVTVSRSKTPAGEDATLYLPPLACLVIQLYLYGRSPRQDCMVFKYSYLLCIWFVCFAVFVFALRTFRRRSRRLPAAPPPPEAAFELSDLHAMRQSGQISDEEFQRLMELYLKQRSATDHTMPGRRGFDVLGPGDESSHDS